MTEWTSWSAWLAALSLVLAVDAGRIDFNRILSGAHIRVTATHVKKNKQTKEFIQNPPPKK